MAIDVAIRANEHIRIISGLILTPFDASLKKVRSPALEAGIGAFLSLIVRSNSHCFLSVTDRHESSRHSDKCIIMNGTRVVLCDPTILNLSLSSVR